MLLMFSYKDQWDPGCTTSKHNIYLIWLYQDIAFMKDFSGVFNLLNKF